MSSGYRTIDEMTSADGDMHRYDLLYELYQEFDTGTLRQYQRFVDVFPPVDSRVALEHWRAVSEELDRRKREIANGSPGGRAAAEIAARATRQQAFTALDLYTSHDRPVDVLVLDVDETLRSAGSTDNEIPRSTLSALNEFHERGVPIIICTGQTLENVKGFTIQGLGASVVQSGSVSIVYEAGTGVFTPGHGSQTKQLLYEDLDDEIVETFEDVRTRVLTEAPDDIRRGCHLQGNEFNVTLKPNYETMSDRAIEIVDRALVHLLDLLGAIVANDPMAAREYYAESDPEIETVLTRQGLLPSRTPSEHPDHVIAIFDRIDVGYYHGDAAEISSLELNKAAGVEAAFDVLGLKDPFAIMLGDSKSDLRVMEWLEETGNGISAAPEHASATVLEHVRGTDDLVFHPGRSIEILRVVDAMNRLTRMDSLDT